MRKFLYLSAILPALFTGSALAQTEDESTVILPLEAQTCNLPVAPARIPEEASYDDLAKAKGNVVSFQGEMESYRVCLGEAEQFDNLTDGNRLALTNAHNYSVEMEERVAEQFNIAVRAYKARQAEQAEK